MPRCAPATIENPCVLHAAQLVVPACLFDYHSISVSQRPEAS